MAHRSIIAGFGLAILVAAASPISSQAVEATNPGYVLGVFPHLPPRALEKVFAPMATDLGQALDKPVVLRSSTTFDRFSKNLDSEKYDIAFLQPFDYVRMADRYGYLPLATRTEKLSAIVVVRESSPVQSLDDLKGKRIALPPRTSAVSRLFENHLRTHKVDRNRDVTLSYHRSHVSCMQKVMTGEADACTTAAPAKRFFEHKMGAKLKSIAQTREIPHTLFAIHPRVPRQDRERVKMRILSWGQSDDGRVLLERGRLKPFVPIHNADYDIVRTLSH